jgi:hypothetical protein
VRPRDPGPKRHPRGAMKRRLARIVRQRLIHRPGCEVSP